MYARTADEYIYVCVCTYEYTYVGNTELIIVFRCMSQVEDYFFVSRSNCVVKFDGCKL